MLELKMIDLEYLFYFSFFFYLVLFYLKKVDKERCDVTCDSHADHKVGQRCDICHSHGHKIT